MLYLLIMQDCLALVEFILYHEPLMDEKKTSEVLYLYVLVI